MSGRSEHLRREIQNSGSALARHSMNQKITGREIRGRERLDGISRGGKKARRAARRKEQEQAPPGADGSVKIPSSSGIVFAEDIEFGK